MKSVLVLLNVDEQNPLNKQPKPRVRKWYRKYSYYMEIRNSLNSLTSDLVIDLRYGFWKLFRSKVKKQQQMNNWRNGSPIFFTTCIYHTFFKYVHIISMQPHIHTKNHWIRIFHSSCVPMQLKKTDLLSHSTVFSLSLVSLLLFASTLS